MLSYHVWQFSMKEVSGKAGNANSIMRCSSPQVFKLWEKRKDSGKVCMMKICERCELIREDGKSKNYS